MSPYRDLPREKSDRPQRARLETLCGCTRIVTGDMWGSVYIVPTSDGRRRLFKRWGYEGGGPDHNGPNDGPLTIIFRETETFDP